MQLIPKITGQKLYETLVLAFIEYNVNMYTLIE